MNARHEWIESNESNQNDSRLAYRPPAQKFLLKKKKLKNKIKSFTLTYSRYQFRKRVESIKNKTTTFRDQLRRRTYS